MKQKSFYCTTDGVRRLDKLNERAVVLVLAQDRDKLRVLVQTIMNIRMSIKCVEFFD